VAIPTHLTVCAASVGFCHLLSFTSDLSFRMLKMGSGTIFSLCFCIRHGPRRVFVKHRGVCTARWSSSRCTLGLSQPCLYQTYGQSSCVNWGPFLESCSVCSRRDPGHRGVWALVQTSANERLQVSFHSHFELIHICADGIILLSPCPNFFPLNPSCQCKCLYDNKYKM